MSALLGNKKFLTGTLSVADFDLAHMVDLYDWLANVSQIDNPFLTKSNLVNLSKTIKSLDGVREYALSPENKSMKWMNPGTYKFDK